MIVALILAAAAGAAPPPDMKAIQKIDTAFVCPEFLKDDQARKADMERFVEKAAAAKVTTARDIVMLRLVLLQKHGCEKTLAMIQKSLDERNAQR